MAVDLTGLVARKIAELQKVIADEESTLASLKDDLGKHEKVYQVLGGADGAGADGDRNAARQAKVRSAGTARTRTVDWDTVLKSLPETFTTDAVARMKAVQGQSRLQLNPAFARWVKAGQIKKLERGKYQKAQ